LDKKVADLKKQRRELKEKVADLGRAPSTNLKLCFTG